MFIKNFNLNHNQLTLIGLTHNLTFHKKFSYCVHHNSSTMAWIGKNSNDESLIMVKTNNTLFAHYLSNQGYFAGQGCPEAPIKLTKAPAHKNTFNCIQPLINSMPMEPKILLNKGNETINLTMRVLFAYSPNYLDTYNSYELLLNDNNNLCALASAIFSNNSTNYNVQVMNILTAEQDDFEVVNSCIAHNVIAMHNLLERYVNGEFNIIKVLQEIFQANVVVLQAQLCTEPVIDVTGIAYSIGFNNPAEACIGIYRSILIYDTPTALVYPTILNHEIGHLLGCVHPLPLNENPNPAFVPGYGDQLLDVNNIILQGTIMSSFEEQIFYYSNPSIMKYPAPYQNIPCGSLGIAEAHLVINNNLPHLTTEG